MNERTEAVVEAVSRALSCDNARAAAIVAAFEQFVAAPLVKKFSDLDGEDVARRNPFVYAALGTVGVDEWVSRVLTDMLSSSAEGLIRGRAKKRSRRSRKSGGRSSRATAPR